jgi:PmbA protein
VADSCDFLEERYRNQVTETVLKRKTERNELRHTDQSQTAAFSILSHGFLVSSEKTRQTCRKERASWLGDLLKHATDRSACETRPAGTGKRKVVLSPAVGAQLAQLLAPWFSAERIHQGTSPLRESVGGEIFSSSLSLVEDGNGVGMPFDMEGTPTQRTVLVERGAVRSWLYDTYAATRDNRLSTGNYFRGSSGEAPSIRPRCLFFEAGAETQAELFQKMGEGVYWEFLDVLEPLPQDENRFFMRGRGWRVMGGQCTEPVSGIESIVDILRLFRGAAAVSKEVEFFSGFGSPSIFIEEMPLGS